MPLRGYVLQLTAAGRTAGRTAFERVGFYAE